MFAFCVPGRFFLHIFIGQALSVFMLLAINVTSNGQTDPAAIFKPKIIPPSPDAASLGRYGEYPVNLSNGLVDISIPIFEIKSGSLTLPISLSYHAGGVKVYDVSSSVGLGWTLNAGGAITRAINGVPDESGYGVLNNPFPSPDGPGEHWVCFLERICRSYNASDAQSDNFYYNLGGSSGKFVFKNVKAFGVPFEIVTIPKTPVRIEGDPASAFTVTGLDGTAYSFNQTEQTVTMVDGTLHSDAITTWYLTSIVSADKSDTITLSYTAPAAILSLQASNTMTERDEDTYTLSARVSYSKSTTTNTHNAVSIREIAFKNGKVSFEYAIDRVDVPQSRRLTSINIFRKQESGYEEIKRFNFYHSYFTATGIQKSQVEEYLAPDVLNKRLRLDSMREDGLANATFVGNPPYRFEYEAGPFPVYGSTAQDMLGFYNGAHSNKNLLLFDVGNDTYGERISLEFGADRNASASLMKAGSLKKIHYPTGGFTAFELEPNQISYVDTVVNPIYQTYDYQLTTRNLATPEITFTVTPEMTGGEADVIANFKLDVVNNIPGEPKISTTVSVFDVTTNTLASFRIATFPGKETAQVGVASTTETLNFRRDLRLLEGHTYRFTYGTGLPTTNNFLYTRIIWRVKIDSTSMIVNRTDYTGGLRIRAITNDAGYGTAVKKQYAYTKWYYNSNLYNGNTALMANFFIRRVNRFADPSSSGQFDRFYFNTYGENVTFQLGASNTVSAYEEVEELTLDTLNRSLGKSVSTFRRAIDKIPSLATNFRSDESWKRGQLARKRDYKSDGEGLYTLLSEIQHEYKDTLYDFVKNYSAYFYWEGHAPNAPHQTVKECTIVDVNDLYRWMDFDQPVYTSNLVSTTSTEYDEDGLNPKATIANFYYDAARHLQLTRTTKQASNGDVTAINNLYALDYQIATCDLQACFNSFNDQLAALVAEKTICEAEFYDAYVDYKISGNNAAAEQAFEDYLNCNSVFQAAVRDELKPQLTSCKNTYSTCINNYLASGAASKDKALLKMQTDGIINQVIENSTSIIKAGTEYITSAVRNDFKIGNNSVLNDIFWVYDAAVPTLKTNFDASPASYLRRFGTYNEYDLNNNLTELCKTNDVVTSYVWDYNFEYPIAEVQNARVNDIAYTSFESKGTGRWTVPSLSRNTAEARTGKKSYSLSNGSVSISSLTPAQTYTVSLWAKNGSVSINGSAATPSTMAVNGWKFYSTSLTGISSVTITGSALVDEVRLFPKGAQMSTYTYDPLTGLTSQSDQNNQTTFYTYDALGRLSTIKDSEQNVLKKFEYHYKK